MFQWKEFLIRAHSTKKEFYRFYGIFLSLCFGDWMKNPSKGFSWIEKRFQHVHFISSFMPFVPFYAQPAMRFLLSLWWQEKIINIKNRKVSVGAHNLHMNIRWSCSKSKEMSKAIYDNSGRNFSLEIRCLVMENSRRSFDIN